MKQWFVLLISMALFAPGFPVSAAGPEEDYIQIYNQIQEADRLAQNQRLDDARARFLEAQAALTNLSRTYPEWNPNVVRYRLNYVGRRLDGLSEEGTITPAPTPPQVSVPAAVEPGDQTAAELSQLRGRIRQLESERATLAARLREALAARPAAIDPQELANADAKILAQQKEIELLKVNLEKVKTEGARTPDPAAEAARQALADAQRQLAQQTEQIATLTLERDALQTRLLAQASQSAGQTAPGGGPAPAASADDDLEELKRQLQTLHQQLKEEQSRNQILIAEKQLLETRVNNMPAAPGEPSLTKRVQTLESEIVTAQQSARADAATISALQTALASANQENRALQERVRTLQAQTPQGRMNALLAPEGMAPTPPRSSVSASPTAPANETSATQLTELQARLAVLEARRVPYSPEELALFRVPPIRSSNSTAVATGQAATQLSRGTALLIADAEKDLRAGRFAEAERKYQEALAGDQTNVVILSSLASAQLEQGNLEPAQRTVGQALAVDPNDAFSLFLLGRLRYEQNRLDEAVSALSRSAHLDSSRAEVYNLLGITLGQLGLREPAETALRRALQILPNYPNAHHNLAVVYASQDPPSIELARWHYEKCLAGGHPADPALEARLKGPSDSR